MFGFFLSSHCFSLLYQGPWGIEVMGARVCCSGQKASCSGLREREEVKRVKKAAHEEGMRLNFCVPQLSAACLLQGKARVNFGVDVLQNAHGHVLFQTLCKQAVA